MPRRSTVRRASNLGASPAPAPHKVRVPGTISEQSSLNMGSKLSENMALRLNTSHLVNTRTRSPPLPMTDRISAPSSPLPRSRESGARSYSILEFNPLVLPESPPAGIAARKAASPSHARRSSPNRSRSIAGPAATAPRTNSAPRANSISVPSSTDGKGKQQPHARQADRRKLSTVTSFRDDDDSV